MTNVKQTVSVVDQWAEIEKLAKKGFKLYPEKITAQHKTNDNGDVLTTYKKMPVISAWQDNATDNIPQLKEWFKPDKNGNITPNGVAFIPKASNVITLDLDNHDGKAQFLDWIKLHEEKGEMLTNQTDACEQTAGKGLHYFFINDTELDIKDGMHLAAGVELKVNSTTIYPSENYEIPNTRNDYKPLSAAELKPMPQWLKDEIKNALESKNKASKDINKSSSRNVNAMNWLDEFTDILLEGIPEGNRNNGMATAVGKLYAINNNPTQVAKWANDINQKACIPPLKQSELNDILQSVGSYSEHGTIIVDPLANETSTAQQANDWMNANDKVKKLPYTVAANIMLNNYNFVKFSEDEGERVAIYVNDRRNSKYGLYVQNYDYIKRLINSMNPLYTSRDIREVLDKIELSVRKVSEPLNDKNLIAVGNGIFDLRTKTLEPFTPDKVLSTKVATNYNAKFQDSKNIPVIDGWDVDTWINDISKDEYGKVDKQVVNILWQVMGDAFNGNYCRNQSIFLYSAQGNTGKGTFQSLIANVVGKSNVAALKIADFSQRFSMSELINKSVCIGDDNSAGLIKDSSNFNSVVTGEPVKVEYKGKDAYRATPKCLVIQSMNETPRFLNKGGTYRRVIFIPFRQHFVTDKSKPNEENRKIKNEYLKNRDVREYVLYKALNNYSEFEFYDIPDVSKALLKDFKKDNDPLQEFYDIFKKWDVTKISVKVLYTAYKRYCDDSGVLALGKNKFISSFLTIATDYKKQSSRISSDEYNKLFKARESKDTDNLLNGVELGSGSSSVICIVKMGTIR